MVPPPASRWHLTDRASRIPITVDPTGIARVDLPITIDIDAGQAPTDTAVVEVDVGGDVTDDGVVHQVDPTPTDDGWTLTLLIAGTTPADARRHYQLYYNAGSGRDRSSDGEELVAVEDIGSYQGQPTWRIETVRATYYVHQIGGGFASMIDSAGNDWISYRPGGGPAGEYRGIPNAIHPESGFHPGHDGAHSELRVDGPLRAEIAIETDDAAWAGRWELFPAFARFTIERADHPYWYLYEGTPGGALTPDEDAVVRSDGTRTPAAEAWTGDLPNPEWVYFEAGNATDVLFHAHHEDDPAVDSYWPMEGEMTVFGFGRDGLDKFLESTPRQFTVGFVSEGPFEDVAAGIEAAYRPVDTIVHEPEDR